MTANYPLALDESNGQALVVFRHPATLAVMAMNDGAIVSRSGTCADSDDVLYDSKRRRVYVSCGEGVVETFLRHAGGLEKAGRFTTASGARTYTLCAKS